MTEGPITKPLILFILPIVGSSIFQQLYNTADFIFVGNLLTKSDAAGVGAASSIITCILGLFMGLSVGTNVLGARAYGEGDKRLLHRILHTSNTFGLVVSAILMVIGMAFSEAILFALNTPADAIGPGVLYMRLYLLSLPFMVVYNIEAAFMRSVGDSGTPFKILVVSGFVNVGLDALFMIVFKWGVAGVSLATVASQGLSVALIYYKVHIQHMNFHKESQEKLFEKSILRELLAIGIPAGIQSVVITISNVFVQYYINGLGTTSVAAFTVYYKLENFFYLPCMGFGQAAVTFAGQNYGAGKYKRITRGAWICTGIGSLVIVLISVIVMMMPERVFGLFINDKEVIQQAISIGSIAIPLYWIYVFLEVFAGNLRGLGHALTGMIITISSQCVLRLILLAYFARTNYTLASIARVYPISWAVAAALFITAFYVFWGRLFHKNNKNEYS